MAQFNPDFWEVPIDSSFLENVPTEGALWFETREDRERRHAMREFFQRVLPAVEELIEAQLTGRQKEVIRLYYFQGLTQEDIAAQLELSQSTVSRHLFGTVRNGRKVGGALNKLRKAVERSTSGPLNTALSQLQERFAEAV
ncbi:MAG: sigma-70 family RNA polymerase sigma factor [Candidatus Hydrogenedentes bacterium]|nr:sigma-70 family RNA polymerase sigma factor [Candidatus Hydrogenedentota bacterium]